MAWAIVHRSGTKDRGDGVKLLLSEEVTAVEPKTLDFDADLVPLILGNPKDFGSFEIIAVRLEYNPTGDAGTRQLFIRTQDTANDTVGDFHLNKSTEASTNIVLNMGVDQGLETGDNRNLPHKMILFPGMSVIFRDSNTVEATDTSVVHIQGILRK